MNDDLVTLYHGTTRAAAEKILVEGFVAPRIGSTVEELARIHEVAPDALWADLKERAAFVSIEHGRGSRVSFTPQRSVAESDWAQRAPEYRRDVLWSVWRLRYAEQRKPDYWHQDVAGHAWVVEQLHSSDPVLITMTLARDELFALDAHVGGFRHSVLTPKGMSLFNIFPEIAFPLPFEPPVPLEVTPIQRRIGWDVFAHWLGLSREEFIAEHESGAFGPAGVGDFEVSPWWPLSAVDEVLTARDLGV
ncbi:hypothetical protein [Puerhibacterium sp. TATVAM-FAB25]|uniref:hypothetical protein n=1 Tax=Puerhibacterium sp. TATVAM-FAB25 TaxID=3093699 RepID=UPI003979AEC5